MEENLMRVFVLAAASRLKSLLTIEQVSLFEIVRGAMGERQADVPKAF
jgi:hypothetical protein